MQPDNESNRIEDSQREAILDARSSDWEPRQSRGGFRPHRAGEEASSDSKSDKNAAGSRSIPDVLQFQQVELECRSKEKAGFLLEIRVATFALFGFSVAAPWVDWFQSDNGFWFGVIAAFTLLGWLRKSRQSYLIACQDEKAARASYKRIKLAIETDKLAVERMLDAVGIPDPNKFEEHAAEISKQRSFLAELGDLLIEIWRSKYLPSS